MVVVRLDNDALDSRVIAELAAAGLDVVSVADMQDDAELAQRYSAKAIVRTAGDNSLLVWMASASKEAPVTEELTLRGLERESLALYAVEHIRARFVQVGLLPDAARKGAPARAPLSPEASPASNAPDAPHPTPTPSFGIEVGALGFAATGGFGTALDGLVGANVRWRAWSASVFAALPLTALEVERGQGSGQGRLTLGGLRGIYSFGEAWRIAPEVGVGLAVVNLSLQSRAAPGFQGRTDVLLTSLSTIEAGFALRIVDAIRVRFRLGAGATMPKTVVRFEEQEVASWGRWVATGGLTLELDASRLLATNPGRRAP